MFVSRITRINHTSMENSWWFNFKRNVSPCENFNMHKISARYKIENSLVIMKEGRSKKLHSFFLLNLIRKKKKYCNSNVNYCEKFISQIRKSCLIIRRKIWSDFLFI